jgi:FkbM family methyltransferase
VDVGAHIGQFNFFAAQYLGARRVISIEPGDDAFLVLKRNALDPADCHCIASSSGPDRLTIYTSTLSSQMNTTVKNVGIVYDGQFVAKAETLDALTARMGLDHIDILKIDTEGSELSVLSASEKTLERVDVIAVEMSVFNVPSNNMFRTGAFLDQKRFRLLEMDCYPAHNPMMMNGVFKKDLQLSQ